MGFLVLGRPRLHRMADQDGNWPGCVPQGRKDASAGSHPIGQRYALKLEKQGEWKQAAEVYEVLSPVPSSEQ